MEVEAEGAADANNCVTRKKKKTVSLEDANTLRI